MKYTDEINAMDSADDSRENPVFGPNQYIKVPGKVLTNTNLSAGSKLMFGAISSLGGRKGSCFAGNGYFEKLFNVSDRTVRNWINELEGQGLVYVTTDYCGSSDIKRRTICLYAEPNAAADKTVKSRPAAEIYSPGLFKVFWELYPRKEYRIKAVELWNKLKPDKDELELMCGYIKEKIRSGQWKDVKFIPYPSTFLKLGEYKFSDTDSSESCWID